MAQEEGLVVNTSDNGWAQVVTDRRDACAECGASHCCAALGGGSSSRMVIKALNGAGARVGDLVSISLRPGTLLQGAALFYIIPLFGLISGAVVGTTSVLGRSLLGAAAPILFSFAGLAFGFLITAIMTKRLASKGRFTPAITRVIKAGLQPAQTGLAVDPVCKMVVDPEEARASLSYQDRTYYFCNPGCKESFAKNPEKYLQDLTFQK